MRLRFLPVLWVLVAAPLAAQTPTATTRLPQNTVRQLEGIGKDLESLTDAHVRYERAADQITGQRDRLGKLVAALAASERGRDKEIDAIVTELAKMNQQFGELQKTTQQESRRFQTLSNASKARHETAMNAVRNMK